jgi:hypothetical protein
MSTQMAGYYLPRALGVRRILFALSPDLTEVAHQRRFR